MGQSLQCEWLRRADELSPVSAEKKHMKSGFNLRESLTLVFGTLATCATLAADIERPQVQFVDKFGVNMANGQVTHNLDTVSIGGAMGLSHSVSVFANEFDFRGMRGFADRYYGRARNVLLCTHPSACDPMNVMRVEDGSSSQSFAYGGPTGYIPIGDERHILEASGRYLLWTKPDGTVVHFDRVVANPPADWSGHMTQIDYPNGFRIWVHQGSVNTNTGFQLKYFFTGQNPPHDKDEPEDLQAPGHSGTWPLLNPQFVRGINAAKLHCPWNAGDCLAAAGDYWPKATFEWPAGMPRTMFIGDSLVKVTDSAKRVTTYNFRAYDLAYDEYNQSQPPYVPGQYFSPRLREIIPPGANATKFSYEYKNLFVGWMYNLDVRLQTAGVVTMASRLGVNNGYSINQTYQGSDVQHGAGHEGGILLVHQQAQSGNSSAPYHVQTIDGHIWFESSARNFPYQFDKIAAPTERYEYETRSNLTKVSYGNAEGDGYAIVAEYPVTCTNRKTCNQATRIRDGNGNWTDYTYDPVHGQVKSITYPANKSGIRPQTRFSYAQKRAAYFNASNVYETVALENAIWMKTAEEYCINSAASGDGCTDGDEVVTTYEYKHPNLLMTGMVVTAPDGVRRTCYEYDDFGNQIGVTTPNGTASLTECAGPGEVP